MFSIEGRSIGRNQPTFIIAEVSGNHHQKYEEAEALIRMAHESGADAVKLQTYTPDSITLKSDTEPFLVRGKDQPASWKGQRLWDLYELAHTPWDWQPKLKHYADELGIILFSTPFDESAVDFLESEVNPPCYKIASYEVVHIPLLKRVAKTGKPIIMSIGFASESEVALAVSTLKGHGARDIAILHCVTAYSDNPNLAEMNLTTIEDVAKRFDVVSGFSDNNTGVRAPVAAAVAFGAHIVEKHVIHSRSAGGPDARFSMEPNEFTDMVRRIRIGEHDGIERALDGIGTADDVEKMRGIVQYGPASPQEEENTFFRPSLWVKQKIQKGDTLTLENIRVARPSGGLMSSELDTVLGKRAMRDIEFATPLTSDLFE